MTQKIIIYFIAVTTDLTAPPPFYRNVMLRLVDELINMFIEYSMMIKILLLLLMKGRKGFI